MLVAAKHMVSQNIKIDNFSLIRRKKKKKDKTLKKCENVI